MQLVQLLLPLYDNGGKPFPKRLFAEVRSELVERFGGLTAYSRAPAAGLWKRGSGAKGARTVRDDLVVFEVMTSRLDAKWWREYCSRLETLFRQDRLVVRAHTVRLL